MLLQEPAEGLEAVVDPRGAVVARLPSFSAGVLEASVQGYEGITPYVRAGSVPAVAAALLAVAAAAGFRRRRRKNPNHDGDLRPLT